MAPHAVHTIYAIRDPRHGMVIYVGQSSVFEDRKAWHLRSKCKLREADPSAPYRIAAAMEDMRAADITPVFETLEHQLNQLKAEGAETRYVRKFAKLGHPLLNARKLHRKIISNAQS